MRYRLIREFQRCKWILFTVVFLNMPMVEASSLHSWEATVLSSCGSAEVAPKQRQDLLQIVVTAPDGQIIPVTTAIGGKVTISREDGQLSVSFIIRQRPDGFMIEKLDSAPSMIPVESALLTVDKESHLEAQVNVYPSGFEFELLGSVTEKISAPGDIQMESGVTASQCCIACDTYVVCCDNCCACGRCCITP